MNMIKIIYFFVKTSPIAHILWLLLSILFRNSIDMIFVLFQIFWFWIFIPFGFGATYSVDLCFKKLESDKNVDFKILKPITIPVFWQKFFCVSDSFSGQGKLLWVAFVFQISLHIYTLVSVALCSTVISRVILDLENMKSLRLFYGFWVAFTIFYGVAMYMICRRIELYCKYKDGENIEQYFFSIHKIDFKKFKESKKLVEYIKRKSIVIEELCKKGLYYHKKSYCIKEKDLTEFKKIIETQYPDLRYDFQYQSKRTLFVVCEKESDAVIFKAVVKKIK